MVVQGEAERSQPGGRYGDQTGDQEEKMPQNSVPGPRKLLC